MKKVFIIILAFCGLTAVIAQPPQSFMYQSLLRNSRGTVLGNQRISAKVRILKASANGTAVYEETQSTTSDASGVITLEVGSGTVVTGNFANIDWLADDYFLKTEIDPIGGSNYILTTTQQLLSVPFAFVSGKTAKLVGIDSALAALNARINQIDSLIGIYNILIRHLNDSVQALSNSPAFSMEQIGALIQRKSAIETRINALRNSLAATKNNMPAIDNRQQQAIITRSAGHICNK